MAEWESSYGGRFLNDARILTKEEIQNRYPDRNANFRAHLTYQALDNGFDILYGVHPNLSSTDFFEHYDGWAF